MFVNGMENGCETGFLTSQPSMAEFMTVMPHISDTFHGPSSITNSPGMPPPPMCQLENSTPTPNHRSVQSAVTGPNSKSPKHLRTSPNDIGLSGVPEYPWMKEKKTTRKHQGEFCNFYQIFSWAIALSNQSPLVKRDFCCKVAVPVEIFEHVAM